MLTVEEVERIAWLGRLALTEEEKTRYARQLSAVLDYAAELARIDVEGISPTATVLPTRNVMRDGDEVLDGIPRADALANAPSTDGAYFIVRAIFEEE